MKALLSPSSRATAPLALPLRVSRLLRCSLKASRSARCLSCPSHLTLEINSESFLSASNPLPFQSRTVKPLFSLSCSRHSGLGTRWLSGEIPLLVSYPLGSDLSSRGAQYSPRFHLQDLSTAGAGGAATPHPLLAPFLKASASHTS